VTVDPGKLKATMRSPEVALGIALVVAVATALLPGRCTGVVRSAAATLLCPGQQAGWQLRRHGTRLNARVRSHFRTADRLAQVEEELQNLKRQNRRLTAELAAVGGRPSRPAGDAADADRLLVADCVRARVLGSQARAFLHRQRLLDVGTRAGIDPEALVVDLPAVIDRGSDARLRPGQLVTAGRRVWGKIVELGPYTSTVRTVTEAGYRDLVRLGGPSGPRGILAGTGEPLCRIRLVEVTEPVSIGEAVYTADGAGVLPAPLLYGHVVRLERPVGAAHWEIWMRPAVSDDEPQEVGVLRIELNPLRVANPAVANRVTGEKS